MRNQQQLATRSVLGYATGSLGTGIFSTVPTVLLLFYCTEILHLPASWSAAIVFVPKIWAIVWDPLVGAWSDRTQSRFGRRRPFMVVGAAGVALAFFALFAAPPFETSVATALWVATTYFSLATVYSVFAVPYIAIPAELSVQRADRTRLVRWRMSFAMIGVLAGAAVAPWIISLAGGGRVGYAVMGFILAVSCALAMSAPTFVLRHLDQRKSDPTSTSITTLLRGVPQAFASRGFRSLAVAYLLMLTAVAYISAAAPYLTRYLLNRPDADVGSALGLMLAVTTVAIPLCSTLGQRIGDLRALSAGALGYGLIAVTLGLSCHGYASWPTVLLLFAIMGAPLAAVQVLPFTLLAHTIHGERSRQGPIEGLMTGIWTATEKVGLALGPAIVGLTLMVAGEHHERLPLFVATVPAALMILALLPLLLSRTAARS